MAAYSTIFQTKKNIQKLFALCKQQTGSHCSAFQPHVNDNGQCVRDIGATLPDWNSFGVVSLTESSSPRREHDVREETRIVGRSDLQPENVCQENRNIEAILCILLAFFQHSRSDLSVMVSYGASFHTETRHFYRQGKLSRQCSLMFDCERTMKKARLTSNLQIISCPALVDARPELQVFG